MYFLGFSINNFTLLALTLAIGIVVDDAIIVLENAYRHQEELDETPEEAAINGTREIGFAVLATTISLVAVFTPLAFLKGSTGRLFNEFGIAVAGSVVISGFVALTLTPMLCAKILRVPPAARRALPDARERLQRARDGLRPRRLRVALRHRMAVVGLVALLTLGRGGRLPDPQARVRAARRTRAGSSPSSSPPRARRWRTPTATSGRPRRCSTRPRTSRATSAWSTSVTG